LPRSYNIENVHVHLISNFHLDFNITQGIWEYRVLFTAVKPQSSNVSSIKLNLNRHYW